MIIFSWLKEVWDTCQYDKQWDPVNIEHATKTVDYNVLERIEGASSTALKRKCPECDNGILLLTRHRHTLQILMYDNCMVCGQSFEMTNIPKEG